MTGRQSIDPYRELGIEPTADDARIRRAYHRKARESHPDLGGDDQVMARLNSAFDVLKDPVRRAAYDKGRRPAVVEVNPATPAWTGASGPPPGRPHGPKLDFGIFAGWTLGEIARRDPGYLVWLSEQREGRPFLDVLETYIAPYRERAAAGSGPRRHARRGR